MRLKSVYTRSFKPLYIENQISYYDNLKYRNERSLREREHAPFDWPGESDSSSDEDVQELGSESTTSNQSDTNQNIEDSIDSISLNTSDTIVVSGKTASFHPPVAINETTQKNLKKSPTINVSKEIVDKLKKLDRVIANKNQFKTAQRAISVDAKNDDVYLQLKKEWNNDIREPALKALENYKNELPKQRTTNLNNYKTILSRKPKTVTQRYGVVETIPVESAKTSSVKWSVNGCHRRSPIILQKPVDEWKSEYCTQYPNYPATVYTRSVATLANFPRPFSTQANVGKCGPLKPKPRLNTTSTNS